MTVNGVTTDYTYNSLDQLISAGSATYDYDDRGNLHQVTDGSQTTTYTYNAADRLASITFPDTMIVTYGYDADGRRIKQTVGSQVTNYLWDEASAYGNVVLETDGSGSTLASYVLAGTQLVSQTRASTTSYFLQDGQGSTRALTNAVGNVTDTYSYTAFGELLNQTGSTPNSYLYTGQQFDALTGLYDLRARYYNPALGRFLSQDAYPYNFNNPVELNRYVYTANNPINLKDPTGNASLLEYAILGGVTGAIVGGISAVACGTSIAEGMLIGFAFGALFGAGLWVAYQPVLVLGTVWSLGSAAAAAYDGVMNGWNTCNTFNFAMSLVMAGLGGRALAKDIAIGGPRFWGPPRSVPGTGTGATGKNSGSSGSTELAPYNPRFTVNNLLNWLIANRAIARTIIEAIRKGNTPSDVEAILHQQGVKFDPVPGAKEPKYDLNGYGIPIELRLHLNGDGTIHNFRFGITLYKGTPSNPWTVNPTDEPYLRGIDDLLISAFGRPTNNRPPSNPNNWAGQYIDYFGNVYLDPFGNLGGLRSDPVHFGPVKP